LYHALAVPKCQASPIKYQNIYLWSTKGGKISQKKNLRYSKKFRRYCIFTRSEKLRPAIPLAQLSLICYIVQKLEFDKKK
jgi:hypothetical protein